MANKVFILLEIGAGKINNVLTNLRKIPGLTTVDTVSKPYDIIARLEMEDLHELRKTIIEKVHFLDGIQRVVSYMSLHVNENNEAIAAAGMSPVPRTDKFPVGIGST